MIPHLDLAALIETVGYIGLFAIIFAESGTIFAFFLPGASLLFTAGFLASQGYLNIYILVPLLGVAAILGDNVGYWFGAHFGPRVFKREDSFFFHKKHIDRTREFYARYGSKTILIARFIPFVRTFAPILAGVGSMHYPTFLFYNIIGGLLWACGVTTLGYTLGSVIPSAADYLEIIVLAIIAVTLTPVAFEFLRSRREVPPKAVMFDLDDTLADAKQSISPDMAERLASLLEHMTVAIVGGGLWEQAQKQVLVHLPTRARLSHLFFMPTSSARCFGYTDGAWTTRYDYSFEKNERARIMQILKDTIETTGITSGAQSWGERFEDRETQITFSGLGQSAPLDAKRAWDPDRSKRERAQTLLVEALPECNVLLGGLTSIDITKKGIDKSVGVLWLSKHLGAKPQEMLYIGDALFEGGNDAIVIPTGIKTRQVSNPEETAKIIDSLLALYKKNK